VNNHLADHSAAEICNIFADCCDVAKLLEKFLPSFNIKKRLFNTFLEKVIYSTEHQQRL